MSNDVAVPVVCPGHSYVIFFYIIFRRKNDIETSTFSRAQSSFGTTSVQRYVRWYISDICVFG